MATFTITTPINYDALTWTTAAGNDAYQIVGGALTIDTDTRYCANHTATSGNLGSVTISASVGGSLTIDGSKVRLIPYNSGSGNVPAIGTNISQGAVSAYLLGVWSAFNVAPTAVGAAMPASGYIKVKNKTGGDFVSGVLSGIGASATGVDTVGWIEVVGVEAGTVTVPRLGSVTIDGEWMEVGTTNGSANQQIQLPASLANTYYPGVWIETAVGAGTYEFYPSVGTATAIMTNSLCKVVWISSQGLLTIGHNGTANAGYTPVSDLKIRIPNIVTVNSTSASMTTNAVPHTTTIGTRYDFTTTSAGAISIDKANLAWYPSFAQAYSVSITDTGILDALSISEVPTAVRLSNVGLGQTRNFVHAPLTISTCLAGGAVSNCVWTRGASASGYYVQALNDITNFTFTNDKNYLLVNRGHATSGTATVIRASGCVWENAVAIGGGRYLLTTCVDCTFDDTVYVDHIGRTGYTSFGMYGFDLSTQCSNITIDGFGDGGVANSAPYNGILNVGTAGCARVKLRGVGSLVSPYDMGGALQEGVTWARSTGTATVTLTGHGYTVGDSIMVIRNSSTSAFALNAAKTVAGVPTADTFTFACSNAGAASGTASFYLTRSAYVFAIAAAAVANDVRVQRVYANHGRTNLYTADNSSKNILIENVFGEWIMAPVSPELNGSLKGVGTTHPMTAQVACYGTHWFDTFIAQFPTSTSSQSWSRSSSTITVTSTSHNLRSTLQVVVSVSSDIAAVPLGIYTIVCDGADTFRFTGVAAGGSSGTLSYAPLLSRVGLLMNEATSNTTSQVSIDSGGAGFTSAGSLYMPTVNDQVTFTSPNYILGHTGFQVAEAVMAGGTIGNYDISYSLDKKDGSGFGSFYNLYYPRSGGSGTSGQYTFTVTNATGVVVGDYAFGTGVCYGAKVTDVNTDTNTITVDLANTATVSGVIRFNRLPGETGINAQNGFKIKMRIKTTTGNTTAITSLFVHTSSTSVSRGYQYPLDLATITLTNVVGGSRYEIYDLTTSTTLATGTAPVDAKTIPFSLEAEAADGDNLRVRVRNSSGTPEYLPFETEVEVDEGEANIYVSQVEDTIIA